MHPIIKLLKKNKEGLTILEIAKELKISRNRVPKLLDELKDVHERKIGRAKVQFFGKIKKNKVKLRKNKKENVIRVLKNNNGLSILEIAKILKISRNTVPVILAELKGEIKIKIKEVGRAKLHYLK